MLFPLNNPRMQQLKKLFDFRFDMLQVCKAGDNRKNHIFQPIQPFSVIENLKIVGVFSLMVQTLSKADTTSLDSSKCDR